MTLSRWPDIFTFSLAMHISVRCYSFLTKHCSIIRSAVALHGCKPVNWPMQKSIGKPKRRKVEIAISPKLYIGSRPNLRTKERPTITHRGLSDITQTKSNMVAGRHFEKNGQDVITPPRVVRFDEI